MSELPNSLRKDGVRFYRDQLTALEISVELGQPILEVEARIALGTIHHEAGRHSEAAAILQRALAVSRDERRRLFEVEALIGLAGARAGQGRGDEAVRTARRCAAGRAHPSLSRSRATGRQPCRPCRPRSLW